MSLLSGLYLYAKFNGNLTEETGNFTLQASNPGGLTYSAGKLGQAIDIQSSYVFPAASAHITPNAGAWEMNFWAKFDTLPGGYNPILVNMGTGQGLYQNGDYLLFYNGGNYLSAAGALTGLAGAYHLITCTYDGAVIEFFVDNVSKGTVAIGAFTADWTAFGWNTVTLLNAHLNHFGIWGRQLGADRTTLWNGGAGIDPYAPTLLLDVIVPDSGPPSGGTAVQLFGDGFTGTSAVEIGGQLCSDLNVLSNNLIECLTPARPAGAYDVVVHNGGTATLVNGFTYVDPPPSVTSLSTAIGPASGGSEVLVSGADFVDGCTVEFGGELATITGFQVDELTVLTPAHVPELVDVVVTNPDAQLDTLAASFRFYDNVAPVVTRLSPPEAAELAAGDVVRVRVTDDVALRKVIILANFSSPTLEEVVFNGVRFAEKYSTSTVTRTPGQVDFSLRRTPGWQSRPELQTIAVDTSGNRNGVTPAAPPETPDAGSPTASSPTPSPLDPHSTIELTVAENVDLSALVLLARFRSLGLEDWIWNGDRFGAAYASSTYSRQLLGGLVVYRFFLRRTPSWPAAPAIDVVAIDTSGNEGNP